MPVFKEYWQRVFKKCKQTIKFGTLLYPTIPVFQLTPIPQSWIDGQMKETMKNAQNAANAIYPSPTPQPYVPSLTPTPAVWQQEINTYKPQPGDSPFALHTL